MVQLPERNDHEGNSADSAAGGGDFVAIMLRRKWVVFLIAAVGCGLGYFYYTRSTPIYKSMLRRSSSIKKRSCPRSSRRPESNRSASTCYRRQSSSCKAR